MTMFRKLTIAVAIAASLGAAFAPSTASAKPSGGFGGYHHHFGGFGIVGVVDAAVVSESCFVSQRVLTPRGYRLRTVNICVD
jgi:hypothetical protein